MSADLTRGDVDRMTGLLLLEFGASWCPHCQAIQPELKRCLRQFPQIRHLPIEDGRGKPLGRSFQVKLWPTLVLMHDGSIFCRLVRPGIEVLVLRITEFVDADGA